MAITCGEVGTIREQKVIYYSDELTDEFSDAVITPRKIDGSYVYCHDSLWKRFTHFFWYRIIGTPFAFIYCKLKFGLKIIGKEKLKGACDGYFMYGNHTQDIGDPLIPNLINFHTTDYFIVHPNNVSMPVLGKVTPSMGALPLPDTTDAYRNFLGAVKRRIRERCCVVIYPEAHIWPYYTKIRNFPDTSFEYPVRFDAPVYCFTNTYQERCFSKKPRIVTYVDGPFLADSSLDRREGKKNLRDRVYAKMCERAENSTVEYIKYVRRETDG